MAVMFLLLTRTALQRWRTQTSLQEQLSQDVDLLVIADQWLQTNREFAGLVYAHQLEITIGQAVRDLALLARALDPEDMRNHVEFLPF